MKIIALISSIVLYSVAGLSIPNPAAVFCVRTAGIYEVRTTSSGAQAGVCIFNRDGKQSECGDWAYLRAQCKPQECALWSVDNNICQTPAE